MADYNDRGYSPSYVNSLTIIICVLLSAVTSVAVYYLMANHVLPLPGKVAAVPQTNTQPIDETFANNVKQALANNPGMIMEALTKGQQAPAANAADIATQPTPTPPAPNATVASNADDLFKRAGSPVLGNPKGDVTLVEFFDFNCGYCRRVAPEVSTVAQGDKKLRVVHKQLPILGEESVEATKISLAALKQGQDKYEKLYAAFIGASDHLNNATMETIVRQQGLDWKKIQEDKESAAVKAEINANYQLAQSLGLNGTPAFVIGDKIMPGAQSAADLQNAIAAVRSAPPAQ